MGFRGSRTIKLETWNLNLGTSNLKREFVLAAVRQNGDALLYAAAGLRADREVVLAAVWQNGDALQHAAAEPAAGNGRGGRWRPKDGRACK